MTPRLPILCGSALLLVACASVNAPPPAGPVAADASASDPDATDEVVLRITGMTCPVRCPREVQEMLAAAPGVVAVSIEWELREAHCTVKHGTDPRSLPAALRSPYAGHVAAQ